MRTWIVAVLLVYGLLVYGCSEPEPDARSAPLGSRTRAASQEPASARVRDGAFETSRYVIPIPEGFERSREHPSALVARERQPHATSFLSSILIQEVPYPDPSMRSDLSDPATCERHAADIAAIIRAQGREPEGFQTEIVELPVGRSCRYQFSLAIDEPHTSRGTALQSDGADFMVVCNIAEGDSRGRAACDEVLRGWRWKDR